MINQLRHRKLPFYLFWLIISIIYAFSFVLIEISGAPISNFHSLISVIAKWLLLSFTASGILCVISINRIIFAILYPILNIICAAITYSILYFGVGLSHGILDVAIANEFSVWFTLINTRLVLYIIFALIFSIIVVIIRWKYVHIHLKKSVDFIFLGLFICVVPYSSCLNEVIRERMPYSIYNSLCSYLNNRRELSLVRNTYLNTSATSSQLSPDVYFVIGEALRADHLPFNGYHRNTMPLLTGIKDNLVSFPHIVCSYNYTHAAVPILLTDTDSLNRDKAFSEQSFISIFKKAGYKSAWFANQELSDSYVYFANEVDTICYCNNVMTVYSFAKSLDKDMMPFFEKWHKQNSDKEHRLCIFHCIGSHWWYKSHYENSVFTPDMDAHDIGSMSNEQIINSYDNTILETDKFLYSLINRIKDSNSIIIYISDHGENLGENRQYFHSNSNEYTLNPACLIWYSDLFAQYYSEKIVALKNNQFIDSNSDIIFHTILDAADIKSSVFSPNRSLFYNMKQMD